MIHVAKIGETFLDFPNAEDISVIIFTYGCSHACPGCHSLDLQFWHEDDTLMTSAETLEAIKDRCKRNNTNKVVFSGGDPFYHSGDKESEQCMEIMHVISDLQEEGYSCCVYTGFYYSQVLEIYRTLDPFNYFTHPDYIKCGEFESAKKMKEWGKTDDDFTLATSNQYFMKKVSDAPALYMRWGELNKIKFERDII